MCNIAGYAGKNAAPKLIEMIRRQEGFDGGLSTGIATIHEGKIYSAKVLGSADDLIEKTDAANLPGDVGIIHSRPAGDYIEYAHPFVSAKGDIAVVMNGTARDDTDMMIKRRNKAAEYLFKKGVNFVSQRKNVSDGYPTLPGGMHIAFGELACELMSCFAPFSDNYADTLAKVSTEIYSDIVTVAIGTAEPDNIFVNRITRPMKIMVCENETYIATTSFAFESKADMHIITSLPLMKSCRIFAGGYEITDYSTLGKTPVSIGIEDFTHAYNTIYSAIKKSTIPPTLDDIAALIYKNKELFADSDGLTQYASLCYDVIGELSNEGKIILNKYNNKIVFSPGIDKKLL